MLPKVPKLPPSIYSGNVSWIWFSCIQREKPFETQLYSADLLVLVSRWPDFQWLGQRAHALGSYHLTKTLSSALNSSCHGLWDTNKERLNLLARMPTPGKGQKQLGTRGQMEDLRKPLSQNTPEKPDPSSHDSHVENGLQCQQLANTAEIRKSRAKEKFDEAGF